MEVPLAAQVLDLLGVDRAHLVQGTFGIAVGSGCSEGRDVGHGDIVLRAPEAIPDVSPRKNASYKVLRTHLTVSKAPCSDSHFTAPRASKLASQELSE